MIKYLLITVLAALTGSTAALAQSFKLIENDKAASLYYAGSETVVNTAIDLLAADSKLVCSHPFARINEIKAGTIIIGIPAEEPAVKDFAEKCKIDISGLSGKWEAFKIEKASFEGNDYLFVLGSGPRGTAYGVLELSRQIGVSPWVWWADVVPQKKTDVTITPCGKVQAPSVQYRGIFLNDEDWALMPWATKTFEPTATAGAIGPKTYAKIFELLLRLRANMICPAMHECTVPFYMVPGNKEAAEKYGIIVSTSHAEPMMRTNTGEWNTRQYGDFNYFTNKNNILSYWDTRAGELTHSENIYTVGLRGIHDGRMQGVSSIDEETRTLENVIGEQRKILQKHNPGKKLSDIPQIFVPYKEVLKAYNNGLQLPEDITLVWCDDNHGYLMRLSDAEEQKRSGGAGVYYHISYWGKPHDYLWLASTQPGLIYAEMKRAWNYGSRRYWVLNVGDIKPGEYLTEFFLDMAWNTDAFAGDKIYAHQHNWIQQTFGSTEADEIDDILRQYYHLAGQRKPEHLGWNKVEEWSGQYIGPGLHPVRDTEFSPFVFGDEIESRIKAYSEIAARSKILYEDKIPHRLKPAYFQLVHYPVSASAAMNRKMLYAQKARLYAEQNTELAAYYSRLATDAYNEISALDYTYNKDMLNGRWELMMDMKPRDLPVFQQPVLPKLTGTAISGTPELPKAAPLTKSAGMPVESGRMIALNASSYTNDVQLEKIEGLGHSGSAVCLPANPKMNRKKPFLEYKITTTSSGCARLKVGTIPMHPANGASLRYAVVVDKQKPQVIAANAGFLSEKWAENVLRNQALIEVDTQFDQPGEHTIRLYALDEEMIFDQLMVEFDRERKHYLIPVRE